MSRNFFPVVMAIGVGVFTGYYTFQPTFQQLAAEKPPSVQSSNPAGSSDKATGAPTSGALPSATKPEAEKNQ
ncbi:uncharacterized protein N7443_004789 [Penicillium atrosanguineum]|uniref:Uncharacterized protein n=1 Tax=Penicillium atrosanguineum TaxID=1132637 RepID=A0A9W9Q5B8_9EURO|nr:uncharacterized protein N7443_004789 [Penicillium atrosanguineum]KAJ5133590.1 hypothetical protein N7526_004955 [Penicillium atrosanguineum]KAJ5305129.1 hypothetical protein N7443_004789 [Penicillium atrosanguineum]KAJ5324594.1 hypothetical protein N7476_003194 [Penicillium atrosanguineum]